MNDPDAARAGLTRRGFLGTGAALAAGAYGLHPTRRSRGRHAAGVRRHRSSSSPRPNPIRNMAACCASGITNRPPHFDLHQSGTFNNLGAMG